MPLWGCLTDKSKQGGGPPFIWPWIFLKAALDGILLPEPKLPVLILSMYPEEQYAVRVMKAGASGYLTKESAPEESISVHLLQRY